MQRILTIDDEIEITKILEEFLTKSGFEVLVANSGEEALTILAKEKIDLLILDKKMPGIGGVGVIKELVKQKSTVSVILLSGSQDLTGETIGEIGKFGYHNILQKPVDLRVLLKKIREVLLLTNAD